MKRRPPEPWPESTAEYIAGGLARQQRKSRDACPYSLGQLNVRSLWLAGWHDTDMTMGRRRLP